MILVFNNLQVLFNKNLSGKLH